MAKLEETKAELRKKLHLFLADPHTFETDIVQSAGRPLALIVHGRQNQQQLEIPIFRVVRDTFPRLLIR